MGTPLLAIVDDDASVRKALLRVFRLARYDAEAFASAAELVDWMQARMPSCVVLDLHLPVVSGIELLRRLSGTPRAPPVVVITADDRPRVARECAALGAKRLFVKPVNCTALLAAVDQIVSDTVPSEPTTRVRRRPNDL